MSDHFHKEIDMLKKKILIICTIVEESVAKAVSSLTNHDTDLANHVIEHDYDIDQKEVDLEEDCLKILALYQPVAIDLRFIIAVLKINSDLERIGDLAVNIAERAVFLSNQKNIHIPSDLTIMAEKVKTMLRKSLDSLVNMDNGLAHNVMISDDEVDAINRDMHIYIQYEIKKNINQMESLIHLLSSSRHLERIADLATNIAEDVIYMTEGKIVRHKAEEYWSYTL